MNERSIAEAVAITAILKDKDLMRDTGGNTKRPPREPHQKPPRSDLRKRHREKEKKPEDRTDSNGGSKMKSGQSIAERLHGAIHAAAGVPPLMSRRDRVAMEDAEAMARVAEQDDEGDALTKVDDGVNTAIAALTAMQDGLAELKPETDEQKQARDKMQELLESGLNPYLLDFAKQLAVFEEPEEE